MTFRMLAAAATVSAGLLLAGCVPSEPIVTPVDTGVVEPIFASDEEALAAAVEAYEGYMRVSGEIGADGGHGFERMQPLVTDELYSVEVQSFLDLQEDGGYQRGFAQIESPTLQQRWEDPVGTAHVVAYVCVDLGEVRFFDAADLDVTNPERQDFGLVEVSLVSDPSLSTRLLVSGVSPWSGSGAC